MRFWVTLVEATVLLVLVLVLVFVGSLVSVLVTSTACYAVPDAAGPVTKHVLRERNRRVSTTLKWRVSTATTAFTATTATTATTVRRKTTMC